MRKSVLILGVGILSLSLTACSITSIVDKFKDPEQLSRELHESPRFLYDTVPAEGYDNVSILSNEFFKGKPYNNMVNFGDNILLIAEGIYGNQSNQEEDMDFPIDENSPETQDNPEAEYNPEDEFMEEAEGDPKFEYSFDVYNPWSNEIIGSLSRDDIDCDYYRVTKDRLLLFSYDNYSVSSYDLELNYIGTFNYRDIDELASSLFYESSDNYLYTTTFSDNQFLKVDPESFEYTTFDSKLYDPSIINFSEDGKYMLLSGINKESLKYTVHAVDTENMQTVSSIDLQSHQGAINDKALVTVYDSELNEWVYQKHNDYKLYFNIPDVRDVRLLPDGTVLIHREEDYDEGDNSNHSVTYYQMDETGKCINDFKFVCPVSSNNEYTYFSSDYVYLKDCNSVMFLVYTSGVNPYILVWDLDANHKVKSEIKSSTSPEGCISSKKKKSASLIKEPDSYNWGKLTSANMKASSLEDKYNIEIYLGPEIPKKIDVFSCKQNTDPIVVNEAVNHLEKILGCYPDNFFNQLCYGDIKGIRIYLAGDLKGDGKENIEDPSGYVCNMDNYMVMVLDSNYYWNWDDTVNHELSHMIDRRLEFLSNYRKDSLYSEDKWNSYNPKKFEYLSNYIGYENNDLYVNNSDYFFSDYGITFPTEDRALIFGAAMDYYLNNFSDERLTDKQSPLHKKLEYYCKCIRDGFNTSGWNDTMPWEQLTK